MENKTLRQKNYIEPRMIIKTDVSSGNTLSQNKFIRRDTCKSNESQKTIIFVTMLLIGTCVH